MKKDNTGKKIKTELIGGRLPVDDVNYAKDNLEEWGFNAMTDFLYKIFHDFCENKRNMSISAKEQKKSELLEKRKKIDDELIKLDNDIEKQKEEEILKNVENKSKEGDSVVYLEAEIESSFPSIEKDINSTGLKEKVEKIIKEVKDNPEILKDDGRFDLLQKALHDVRDSEGTPYFIFKTESLKKYVKYKAGIKDD